MSTGTNTRAIILGSGSVWSLFNATVPWNVTSSLSLTSTGSTVNIADTSANNKTFTGGGLIYNNLNITGGGAGAVNKVTFANGDTFANLTVTGEPKSFDLYKRNNNDFYSQSNGFGNGTNIVTINATTGGNAQAFLSLAEGPSRVPI